LARILRGEVYWADWNPVQPRTGRIAAGSDSQHDLFNRKSETVIAMAIVSQPQKAEFPLTLELPRKMLPKSSWVQDLAKIRTISVDRLGKRIAVLHADALDQLIVGCLELIG